MATSAPVPRPAPAPRPSPTSRPPGVPTAPAAAAPATAAAAPKSRLGAVKRGLLREAKRFFFYGPEGVGKSSLAADAGSLFFDTDRGSGHLDVPRYPFRLNPDGSVPVDGHIAQTLEEIYAGVDDLLVSDHTWRALAIDTSDALEALIWKHVCEHAGVKKSGEKIENIEDFGYGKGYNVAADEWRKLLHRLDELRLKRGMHIVFVGHSLVKTFKNPNGEDFDRYRPKMDDRALGLLREWCEVVGFVTFDDVAKKAPGASRARGISTGYRIIHLEHNAAWDAKSRLALPSQIDLLLEQPWAPFAAALEALYNATPEGMRKSIELELARLGDDFVRADGNASSAASVRAAVATAGDDVSQLARFHVVLTQSQPKEQNQ
jgi:hypothetical protein